MRCIILPNGDIRDIPEDMVKYHIGFKKFIDNYYYMLYDIANIITNNYNIAAKYMIRAADICCYHIDKYNYIINEVPDNSIEFVSSYIPKYEKIKRDARIILNNGESGSLIYMMNDIAFSVPFIDIDIDENKVTDNLLIDIKNWKNIFMLAFKLTIPALIMYAVNYCAREAALNLRGYKYDSPDNGGIWPLYPFSFSGFKPIIYCSICGVPSSKTIQYKCDSCGAHYKMFKKWPDIDKIWTN